MKLFQILYSVFNNKCPRCHQGKIFKRSVFDIKNMFQMNNACPACHELFEKEPGFFYGAMYVSYALTTGLLITVYVTDLLFFHLGLHIIWIISVLLILLAPVTFRWSRIIWLNFFVKYNPDFERKNLQASDQQQL